MKRDTKKRWRRLVGETKALRKRIVNLEVMFEKLELTVSKEAVETLERDLELAEAIEEAGGPMVGQGPDRASN